MSIDKEHVKHVAELARLKIEECDMEKWSRDLDAIIGFADSLGELCTDDTDTVPSVGNGLFNVFREDETGEPYPNAVILSNAPQTHGGCYAVPKTVE